MSPCFLYILLFSMSSTSYNHWLQDIFLSQKASNILSSLISINYRYRAVHQYQAKAIVLLKRIFNYLNGFMTIKRLLNDIRNIFIASLQQNNFKSDYIIGFIINDQDASILVNLINYFRKLRLFLVLGGVFGFLIFLLDDNPQDLNFL